MLTQNTTLQQIAAQCANAPPHWPEVAERFKSTPHAPEAVNTDGKLAGFLSHIHLRTTLERVCAQYASDVRFNPIHDGAATQHYQFQYSVNGISVIKEGLLHSEIEELALIDDRPVVFEVLLMRYEGKSNRRGDNESPLKGKKSIARRGIPYAMRDERIAEMMAPIKEHFARDEVGYVLIISSDQIKPKSDVQQHFREQGGILIPFYTDRRSYREEVVRMRGRYMM